ncbi:peptidase M3 [Leptolyngbya sp. 'hensonii']|uniref:M3 family metallopeptidase n=1 Tax=Leptolyngbya sp. 'hensonii' TaxID=1922337 RepID=UPI0009502ACE|nr:M3 family metallopeptidase [Leptolyngbya sp. 'hensonii']OLP16010.1 peptidase M3 [Leptolyngbya sp. 'hensonii']
MTVTAERIDNPLLIGKGLPPFDRILPEHIVPAITQLLTEMDEDLAHLEADMTPTWAGLMEPLQHLEERLSWSWGVVSHLMGVKNSPELRQAYETMQPEVVKFWTRLSQSPVLYQGYKALRDGDNWNSLDESQQRIIRSAIRDAELSGVGLEGETREQFNAIQLELAELSTRFSNHVLDATKAFSLTLTQREEVEGLPPSLLALAAQAARAAGQESATPESGPWRITLDFPSYGPLMQHSRRRELREQVYRAFISRAASGDLDNKPLIDRILILRQQMAALLGYASYADLRLTERMAPNVAAVETLLEQLRQASYNAALGELEDLQAFVREQDPEAAQALCHWDLAFWSERQREERFAFNAEELRPYFPLEQVLSGLFNLAQQLFGVTITPADGLASVWHPEVRYFRVADETGAAIAYFYLDPYSRPAEKRGGAWMDVCLNRGQVGTGDQIAIRLPVAYLVCNQTPPIDDKPSLMTFTEVETLFHEFGHGLQHMLTRVNYSRAAGISNIEWDAVELPSQFMENWCYHRSTLFRLGRHYETGEPLPEHYYQKLLAARTYMSGTAMLRQIHFSLVDLELHHRYQPGGSETPFQVRDRLAQTTTVLPPLPEDAFLCGFGHIFAGGYAAGYYSYKWAEVLSADAFSAFEEAGLEDEAALSQVGHRFRETVLALGGGQHPMEVFKAFRGREPDTTALLRHYGLAA